MTYREEKKTRIGTIEVRGDKVAVWVSESGSFSATFAEKSHTAETFENLRARLMETSRKKKIRVSVPAYQLTSHGLTPILLTGINARTDGVEFKEDYPSATTKQLDWRRDIFKPLNKAQIAEAVRLRAAMNATRTAWDAWVRDHTLDARKAVEAAIEKAVAEERATEDAEAPADPR